MYAVTYAVCTEHVAPSAVSSKALGAAQVMHNLFPRELLMHEVYDLKGPTAHSPALRYCEYPAALRYCEYPAALRYCEYPARSGRCFRSF